jgi:hypothetical protein
MSARAHVILGLACLAVSCTSTSVGDPDPLEPQPDASVPEVPEVPEVPGPDAAVPDVPEPDAGMTNPDAAPPDPPQLGETIDRVGRLGINTLLTRAFDGDASARDEACDRYNRLTPKDDEKVVADLVDALALWDGIDRNCGNQFLSTPVIIEGRYERLAGRLGDDVLYVDTRSGSCWYYLGLETNAQGVVPNNDCGGRTLTEDAVDVFYAILVNGMRGPIRDGVARDDRAHSNEVFPFVAAPGSSASVPPPSAPLPSMPTADAGDSERSCKNLGYTDAGGGGGSFGFGAPCGASSQCAGEDGLCVQNTCFYGGFCTTTCIDGDDRSCDHVGPNLACEWVAGGHACVQKWSTDGDCGRAGYSCGPEGYCISQSN